MTRVCYKAYYTTLVFSMTAHKVHIYKSLLKRVYIYSISTTHARTPYTYINV